MEKISRAKFDDSQRIVIKNIEPLVEWGKYPAKAFLGDQVQVSCHIFSDGHQVVGASLQFKHLSEKKWSERPMVFRGNDRFEGSFDTLELGYYQFRIVGWVDEMASWWDDITKKVIANEFNAVDFMIGADLLKKILLFEKKMEGNDRTILKSWAQKLSLSKNFDKDFHPLEFVKDEKLYQLFNKYKNRHLALTAGGEPGKSLSVWVDRRRANFSAWYEFFPRSASSHMSESGHHGSFKDCHRYLPYLQELGFDIIYFPPIHPIGFSFRKGRNNAIEATLDDPGCPWGIGATDGGHKSIHSQLGSIEDFRQFLAAAESYQLEVALDLAFQCSPDHPYVKQHPQWFLKRPDGSIQYAQNPPKKYQDIYPFNFECEERQQLWHELKSIVLFWMEQGVRIFRVDNPHTKPFIFWQWLIEEVHKIDPGIIFLSEAFTRPEVMKHLAQIGFSGSYTYFTWKKTAAEMREYVEDLNRPSVRNYFRPHFWPNTPDILSGILRNGPESAFALRLVLAAMLSGNYGIYGPSYEWCENTPRDKESEEYLNSEKYQIKSWDLEKPPLKSLLKRLNHIRRASGTFQQTGNGHYSLYFHQTDNPRLLIFSRATDDFSESLLIVVNMDDRNPQSGWTDLNLEALGLKPEQGGSSFEVEDLLQEEVEHSVPKEKIWFRWQGARNYILLDPQVAPAHIFRIHPFAI